MILGLAAVLLMVLIEQVLLPSYCVKSAAKIILFAGLIFLYAVESKEELLQIIRFHNRKNTKLLLIMLSGFVMILLGFFLFQDRIDLSAIKQRLYEKEGLTRENCLYVFAYIMLVNSFLEEAFFRGFLYHIAKTKYSVQAGYLYSSLLFALYHIGIISSWFDPLILVLSLTCLFLSGVFLQFVSVYFDDLKASWMIHLFSNLAINTIGFIAIFYH